MEATGMQGGHNSLEARKHQQTSQTSTRCSASSVTVCVPERLHAYWGGQTTMVLMRAWGTQPLFIAGGTHVKYGHCRVLATSPAGPPMVKHCFSI